MLERLTARQPMLLALDDVHWADAASVEVLTPPAAPVPGPAADGAGLPPAARAARRRARGGDRAAPSGPGWSSTPLSTEDAQRLIGDDLDDATRAVIYRESGGNPFYIEQLARTSRAVRSRPPADAPRTRARRFPAP